jgi:hypothetical protein
VSLRVIALALLAAGLSAGCGASDRDDDVGAVAQRFQSALEARDGAGACAELSEETASKVEQQEGMPCQEAILGLELPTGSELAKARVYVTSASISVAEGGTLFLNEAADGWEVSAAGCHPTAPELPYECEVED